MECFRIFNEDIEGRIDPNYYTPDHIAFNSKLTSLKYKVVDFDDCIRNIFNGLDFRDFSEFGSIYLRVADIKPFEIDLTDVKRISLDINEISKNIELKRGTILLTRKGTFGIATCIQQNLDYIISSEIFKIDLKEGIDPEFITILLNSSICKRQFDRKKIGGIMGSLSQDAVKSIKIPSPSPKVQEKIIEIMKNAYSLKKQKESEAKDLLGSIDDFVFDTLKIKFPTDKDKVCYSVSSDDLQNNRIDPYYYQPTFKNLDSIIETVNYKTLNAIIHFSNETWNQEDVFEDKFPYLEISQIDIDFGTVKEVTYYEKVNAPSRAKMIVREGDIIVSTTRPHRGAISMIDKSKDGFVASTGFAILRDLKTTEIERDYLYIILRTKLCLHQMLRRSSGGNYPAITSEELKKVKIPLPHKDVQNTIYCEVKSRIEKAKLLQQDAQEILEKAESEVEIILMEE